MFWMATRARTQQVKAVEYYSAHHNHAGILKFAAAHTRHQVRLRKLRLNRKYRINLNAKAWVAVGVVVDCVDIRFVVDTIRSAANNRDWLKKRLPPDEPPEAHSAQVTSIGVMGWRYGLRGHPELCHNRHTQLASSNARLGRVPGD